MGTTANYSWPYPESSDFVADGATAIENLADAADATVGAIGADVAEVQLVTILQDTISLANGTNVTPSFSTEIIDAGGWHGAGSNSIVAPYDGVYLITANVVGVDSTNRALVNIVNATTAATLASDDNNSGGFDLSAAVHAKIDASDQIRLLLFQNSGVTKTPVVTFTMSLVRRL